ncbi:RagB/SusD family nutrient uptake outer membrane protein [Chryseobacterium wangxinyae]|uniref:RagB/SusD family nutrient uptake outer membrane protein n=1 Tax=Chryseobacterium sp. CY353 TaxID=2997334 RepID=UPI00226F2BC0|nr:RagB/SusD family nutrient uptake outer membrane protein [Chryseobacterium sp. CY353]MCY0969524.1 RagB/SusD family nutrient uptake outer membrane protein [Chryseobacterium sp. CY353]
MKINKIKFFFIGIASLGLISCTDVIDDQLDPDGVIEENVFKTLKNSERVLVGSYSRMPLGANLYAQSLITDELKYNQKNNGQGKEVHSWTFTAQQDEFAGVWYGAYGSVSNANKFLLNFDKIPATTPEDIALKAQLKGEALAIRAFNHFMLVRLFSPKYQANALGIPYIKGDDIYAQPSRPTMQETYTQILNDCNEAYPLLANVSVTVKNRFNQAAVRAMQAYISLEMNNFDQAITFANQALTFNSTLANTLATVQATWTDTNTTELLFFQTNIAGSASAAPGTYFTTDLLSNGGILYWNPSVTLYNKFSTGDFRRARYFSGTPTTPYNNFIVNKYPGSSNNYGINNIKVFRVADLYMILAEANARKATPDLTAALNAYATLRTARNAGVSLPFTDQNDAITKILDERAREFAWEGSRLLDLKRNGRLITRQGVDIYILNPVATLTDLNRYTFPIPTSETQANPNIQQNPGY